MVKKRIILSSLAVLTATAILLGTAGCARKTPEKFIADVQEALKQGDYPNAIIKLEDFLEKYPNDPRAINAQFQIGEVYAAQGKFDKAVQEYQKVIDKYPAKSELNMGAKFAIAACYASSTSWDKARDIWTKLSQDTTNALAASKAKFNIARSYEDQQDWTKAEAAYKDVLAYYPLPKPFPKIASENASIEATMGLAGMYSKAGKTEKAVQTLTSLQGKYPGNEYAQGVSIYTQVMIGDIYRKNKQNAKAIDSYKKAIAAYSKITSDKNVPDKAAWATMKMGEVYAGSLNDLDTAKKLFQSVVKEYPKSQWAQYAQAGLARINQVKSVPSKDTTGKANLPVPPIAPPAKK